MSTPEQFAADNYYSNEPRTAKHDPIPTDATRVDHEPLRNGDSIVVRTRQEVTGGYVPLSPVVAAVADRLVADRLAKTDPASKALDYSDVDDVVTRSISTAQMLASLRVSGEQVDPAATEATVRRIHDLRLALAGIGQVGQHFNAVGTPVGDEVAVILSVHDVNALIMRLTGKVRFETI